MTSQVDVMCCKSVGTDLSMLDIDGFITEIFQLKKEVALLEAKLRARGDQLNTEILVKVETYPTDSNHTLNQDESTDRTTESLDSVCITGEQQILHTKHLNMCSVKLMDCRKLMEIKTEPIVKEEQTDEDNDLISSVKLLNRMNIMEKKTESTIEEFYTDEDYNNDDAFILSDESSDLYCDGETASTSKQRLTAQTLSCITRGKTFSSQRHLKTHERKHTEQKL
ncbi:uncharacterized protein LOC130426560 [Triplophysa dalaica]|uniref:uncharacterized protein LOC130426560 n=1 Tax=Triplophysa dalaica TaxID=1582913 RepID=UPI0024DF97EB|nr:uncharacterized protein LOC130426560 [Triplophysa dalaica]